MSMLSILQWKTTGQNHTRIKKWSIVVGQIRLHKSKQKPFVVYCAYGIVPRLGKDEFQIVTKLLACQISGTKGAGFGKLHIKVLLTQGYNPGEKICLGMLGLSICFMHQRTSWLKICEHDEDDLLLKTFTNYPCREV